MREARGVRLQVCEPPGTGKSLGTGVEGVWGRAWVRGRKGRASRWHGVSFGGENIPNQLW